MSDSTADRSGDSPSKAPSERVFELFGMVDFGLQFRANQIFAFYTGAGIILFDWQTDSFSGSPKNEWSAWAFHGFGWMNSRLTDVGTLGIGMTVTPFNNMVIGLGLNTLLDRFIAVDLRNMSVGNRMTTASGNNMLETIFTGLRFDITASYKF